ncbi:hypothetical protein Tco_0763123 [Tanacetum coccineum]
MIGVNTCSGQLQFSQLTGLPGFLSAVVCCFLDGLIVVSVFCSICFLVLLRVWSNFSEKAPEVVLNSLWREFDIMTKLPKCSCAAREDVLVHNQLMKLMQFLIGLNDVYQPIRSSILSRENLPEVRMPLHNIPGEGSS